MANIFTTAWNNWRAARDIKRANRLIDEIDSIVRDRHNQKVLAARDANANNDEVLSSRKITGKLKKRLAPTRDLSYSGIYLNRFNLSDIYAAYVGESLIKFAVDHYVEACIRAGYYIKSKNDAVVRYLQKRLSEFQVVSNTPFNEFLRDFVMALMLYGNVYIVKHRQADASSGLPYTRWDGKQLDPIASLYIEDARKMIIGEAAGGKMRYLRLPIDVGRTNINLVNPALFSLPKNQLLSLEPGLFSFNWAIPIESFFTLTPRRRQDFVLYDAEDIHHVRYHHMPGEKIAMPPFWPVLNDIDSLRRIEENIELLVFQYGHPILHGKVGDDKFRGTDDEIEDVMKKLEMMESNGFLITDNRVLLEFIGAESSALRLEAYLQYFYRRVLSGLWLSEIAVGQGDTANRATADTLDKLAQEKVTELQQIVAEAMQNIFIELLQEAGADIHWIISPDNIPSFVFEPIDLEGKIRRESHIQVLWTSSMLTQDEMRRELGREPLSGEDAKKTYNELVAIPLKTAGGSLPSDGTAPSPNGKASNIARPENQYGKKSGPGLPKN